ncbi:hypothetical protein DFH06DRAFT_1138615 [Mycena polygramma]|nr:hypothetical protein DFH06DRAFT_1138615 [Mycena polygramma]
MAAFLAAQQLCLPHLFTTFKGRILQRVFEHPPTLKDGWGGLYMYQIPLESKMKFGISECPPRRRREWERQCWPEQQVWLPWYWYVPYRKKFEKVVHAYFKAKHAWCGRHPCSHCPRNHQERFWSASCGGIFATIFQIEALIVSLGWPVIRSLNEPPTAERLGGLVAMRTQWAQSPISSSTSEKLRKARVTPLYSSL